MNEITLFIMKTLSSIFSGTGVLILCVIIGFIFIYKYNITKSRQLLNSLPGIFTSMGLLGTFCAICYALGDIQTVPNAVDNTGKTLAEVQASGTSLDITEIVAKLIPAFTSSISGLIMAFLATIITKFIYANEEKALDEKVDKKNPEEMMFNIANVINSISIHLKEEAVNSKNYNERLNTTINKQSDILAKFINDFVERMDEIFVKMKESIESQVNTFGEEQFTKTSKILESITKKLTESSESLITEQKQNVAAMIEGTQTELKSISDTVKTQISQLSSETAEALRGIEEKHSAEYEKIHQDSLDGLQKIVDLKNNFQEVSSQMVNSTIEMNREISTDLRDSLNNLVAQLQASIKTECTALSEAIAENVSSLQKSYEFISDHLANIKGNYDSAALAFQDAVNNANRYNESSEKILKAIDNGLGSLELTNKKVEDAIAVMTERQDVIERMILQYKELNGAIAEMQKLEKVISKIVNRDE